MLACSLFKNSSQTSIQYTFQNNNSPAIFYEVFGEIPEIRSETPKENQDRVLELTVIEEVRRPDLVKIKGEMKNGRE